MIRIKDDVLKKRIHEVGLNNFLHDREVEEIFSAYFSFLSTKVMKEKKSLRITHWGIFYPKEYIKKKDGTN